MERPLVRVSSIPDDVPETTLAVDSLPQASARVVKILHSHAVTGRESGASDLLRGDAYVLRQPAELDSRLISDRNDTVVRLDERGRLAYRIEVTRTELTEPAYTTLAINVADTTDAFREVVFAMYVDRELTPTELPSKPRVVLEQAIERDEYRETTPLSDGYERLLESLGLADVSTAKNGQVLWYEDQAYRYGLYVNTVD